jgi:glycosyltransferase involved in cell wall biosynthesis
MKVSVILPSYNEEARLPNALDKLIAYFSTTDLPYEIMVSADGCTDQTEKIASRYAAENQNITLVSFPERLGKGGGILNAAGFATGDILIMMDVDLSVPPEQILPTIRKMEEEKADIIYGSRNLPESNILVESPLHRKLLGKTFNFLFRLLFGIDLHDTQCGFKAIKKEVLASLQNDLNIKGFAYDIDLAVEANRHGYKIVEMPVTWSHGAGSKVSALKQAIEMGHDLLTVWLEGKKREAQATDHKRYHDSIP